MSFNKGIFSDTYILGPEEAKIPPFVLHEVTKKSDGLKALVKVFMKCQHSKKEIEMVLNEVKFWRKIQHHSILSMTDCFDDDAFIYILYEFPAGGDINNITSSASRSFTEGFARQIALQLLDALIFIHSNGIVHGGCLSSNIVFTVDRGTPGWVHSMKLAFFRSEDRMHPNSFHDLQDFAYTMFLLMRRRSGYISRQNFDLNSSLSSSSSRVSRELDHLSPEFYDFIIQLWNAEKAGLNADSLMNHLWLRAPITFSKQSQIAQLPNSLNLQGSTTRQICSSWIQYKLAMRDSLGRRSWKRAYGTMTHCVIILYANEKRELSHDVAQCMPPCLPLFNKIVAGECHSRHPNTFALSDGISQEICFWIRCPTAELFDVWKAGCMEALDPTSASRTSVNEQELTHPNDINPENLQDNQNDSTNAQSAPLSVKDLQAKDIKSLRAMMSELGIDSQTCADKQSLVEAITESGKIVIRTDDEDIELFANENIIKSTDSVDFRSADSERYAMHLHVQSSKTLRDAAPGNFTGIYDSQVNLFAPLPSDHKVKVQPCIHWVNRGTELRLVITTGTPINAPVETGSTWYILDAAWYNHWVKFVSSHRRMAAPGAIDNMWMINYATNRPFAQLVEETDTRKGDFRRVTAEIWNLFIGFYGGGPCIKVTGGPIEDTRRWEIVCTPLPQYVSQIFPKMEGDMSEQMLLDSVFDTVESNDPFQDAFISEAKLERAVSQTDVALEVDEEDEELRTHTPFKTTIVTNYSSTKATRLIREISHTLANPVLPCVISSNANEVEQQAALVINKVARGYLVRSSMVIKSSGSSEKPKRRFSAAWEMFLAQASVEKKQSYGPEPAGQNEVEAKKDIDLTASKNLEERKPSYNPFLDESETFSEAWCSPVPVTLFASLAMDNDSLKSLTSTLGSSDICPTQVANSFSEDNCHLPSDASLGSNETSLEYHQSVIANLQAQLEIAELRLRLEKLQKSSGVMQTAPASQPQILPSDAAPQPHFVCASAEVRLNFDSLYDSFASIDYVESFNNPSVNQTVDKSKASDENASSGFLESKAKVSRTKKEFAPLSVSVSPPKLLGFLPPNS